ncbi:MAG: glycosyltransferase family A protein [Polaribacter sp.]
MRIGINPEKNNKELDIVNYHRIIIPVYIPHFNDYFKDALEVFKLCLESLLLTVHTKTRITIYNNNSHQKVKDYIDKKYEDSFLIDQVFHSKENVGKVNAILAASKGNLETLITITDADVLFKNGWQKACEDIFINFPEAGMVSPVPLSKLMYAHAANNWYYGFFKGKLSFQKVLDSEAMHKFDVSLGNDKLQYNNNHLENYLVLKNKNKDEAVMGCGHFVATLKRAVFDKGSNEPAFIKIVGGVENKFIDNPNEDLGFLRLATKENLAFHMGNATEDWMFKELKNLTKEDSQGEETNKFNHRKISKSGRFVGKMILKIVRYKKFNHFFLRKLGLKNPNNY